MPHLNPFERIRSAEGKVFLLLCGLAVLVIYFELLRVEMRSPWWLIGLEGFVIIGYIVIATFGTTRIVAKPVRRAVESFRRISQGDYSTPILTRRTDKFGDMLRALDGMRQNLALAVRARDEAERRYREIVERSVEGFYQSTLEGDLLAANDALAQMLGYESATTLLEEPPGLAKRVYVDPSRRTEHIELLAAHGFVTGFEAALRRRDGLVIWVSQSARLVYDEDGGGKYYEGFLVDITARKLGEQLKADFVGFVTHQLRTPLAGIRWMIELAREEVNVSPTTDSYLVDALASTERLIVMVNELLDITRLESGRVPLEPVAFDPQSMIAEIVEELAPLAGAKEQRVSANTQGGTVYADPRLTRQALINLISNAIKYTPRGGNITVETRRHGSYVSCAVRDTGIGIPLSAQSRLFEKFFRADNAMSVDTEGTGLGLYLVRLIAERSGGSVTCESVEQQGSTFVLNLPAGGEEQKAIA